MENKKDTQKKSGKRKVSRFGQIKLIVLVGVLIYTVVTFANLQSTLAVQLQRQAEQEQKNEELQREIDYLRNELNYIGTDEYIEQQARIRLGWLYPDEEKYVEGQGGSASGGQDAQQPQEGTEPPAE